jgi:hypothetical protein
MTNQRQTHFSAPFLKARQISSKSQTLPSYLHVLEGVRVNVQFAVSGNVSNKQLVVVAVSCNASLLTEVFSKSLRNVKKYLTQDFAS